MHSKTRFWFIPLAHQQGKKIIKLSYKLSITDLFNYVVINTHIKKSVFVIYFKRGMANETLQELNRPLNVLAYTVTPIGKALPMGRDLTFI